MNIINGPNIYFSLYSTLSSGINSVACVFVEDVLMEAYIQCCSGARIRQKTLNIIARALGKLPN